MKKFVVCVLLLALALSLYVMGCKKEEEPQRPTVPSSGILSVDFSVFTNPPSLSKTNSLIHCPHFDTAAVIVTVWAALTQAFFAIPQLAFVLAISQQPTYEGDLTWKWQFGADTNNISLYAHVLGNDSVDWVMRVTNTQLNNFPWYEGRCDFNATGGWWRFNRNAGNSTPAPALLVNWQKSQADTTGLLLITNIAEDDLDNMGDTLRWERNANLASCTIVDVAGERAGTWHVRWHLVDHWGSITYPENTQGCWRNDLSCIPCDSLPAF